MFGMRISNINPSRIPQLLPPTIETIETVEDHHNARRFTPTAAPASNFDDMYLPHIHHTPFTSTRNQPSAAVDDLVGDMPMPIPTSHYRNGHKGRPPGTKRRRVTTQVVEEEEDRPPILPSNTQRDQASIVYDRLAQQHARNKAASGAPGALPQYTQADFAAAIEGLGLSDEERENIKERIDAAWKHTSIPEWNEMITRFGVPVSRLDCWGCRRIMHGRVAHDTYQKMYTEFYDSYIRSAALIPAAEQTAELFCEMLQSSAPLNADPQIRRIGYQNGDGDEYDDYNNPSNNSPPPPPRRRLQTADNYETPHEWRIIDIISHFFFHCNSSDCELLLHMWINSQINRYFVTEGLFQFNTVTNETQLNMKNLPNYHRHASASVGMYNQRKLTHRLHQEVPTVVAISKPKYTHTVPHMEFNGMSV